jgi:hypothetical protein
MIWILQLKQFMIFTFLVMAMVPLQVYAGYRFIDYLADMHVKQKYRK